MRNSRAGLYAILLCALPLAAQTGAARAAGDKSAGIEGIVTNAVTGAPVPRVNVTLQGNGDTTKPAKRYGTTSGPDGRFSITGLIPDSYRISGKRVGFAAAMPYDIRVTLNPGDSKTGVEIKLAPTGTVTGHITNADGEPVEGAFVTVEGNGQWITTDEKGQYRIGGVAPDRYRVQAVYHGDSLGGPPEIRTDGTSEVHLAPTYYPGVLSKKEAALVQVRSGSETNGVDIQLMRVPFVRVSGKIVGIPRGTMATLLVAEGMGYSQISLPTGGSFALWRLIPGKYTLSAQWIAADGTQVHTSGTEIEVADSNIDNIELRVVPDSDIAGQLEFEDDEAKQTVPKEGAKVSLAGGDDDGESAIDAESRFHLDKVRAWKYRVDISWENAYIKSMRLGATQIEGSTLNLNNGSGGAELSILIAAATGSVSGAVHVDAGATDGTTVVLAAAEPGTGFESRTREVGPDGAYSFNSVPPGNYKIVAVPEYEVDDDNSVSGFEDQMEPVEVHAKEKVTKDLAVRTPPGQ